MAIMGYRVPVRNARASSHLGATLIVLALLVVSACSSRSPDFRELGKTIGDQAYPYQAGIYADVAAAKDYMTRVAARDASLLTRIDFNRDVALLVVLDKPCLGDVHADFRLDRIDVAGTRAAVKYKVVTTPAPEGNACSPLVPKEVHVISASRSKMRGVTSASIYLDGKLLTP